MESPIRVAEVMGYMNGGGVEAVVMNYYRHIDRTRVQFDLIVCEGSTLIPRDEIESLGGRVFIVPSYSRPLQFMAAVENLIREQGWKIVHSHMNALSVFPLQAAKMARVPVRIAHSHSTSGKGEYVKNLVKAVLKTQANRYPTNRFACSRYAGEWLFGKDSDFQIVYNAIDLDRFRFNAEARAQARADLGLVGVEAQVSGLPCLLSDTITREVDVTRECRFLTIDDPSVWAGELRALSARTDSEREAVSRGSFDDYDIESQGKRLTENYLNLYPGK